MSHDDLPVLVKAVPHIYRSQAESIAYKLVYEENIEWTRKETPNAVIYHDPSFEPRNASHRTRLVKALNSLLVDEVSWALAIVNSLSFKSFPLQDYAGLLAGLINLLDLHLQAHKRSEPCAALSRWVVEPGRSSAQPAIGLIHAINLYTVSKENQVLSEGDIEPSLCNIGLGEENTNDRHVDDDSWMARHGLQVGKGSHGLPMHEIFAYNAMNALRNIVQDSRNAMVVSEWQPGILVLCETVLSSLVSVELRKDAMEVLLSVAPHANCQVDEKLVEANAYLCGDYLLRLGIRLLQSIPRSGTFFPNQQSIIDSCNLIAHVARKEKNESVVVNLLDEFGWILVYILQCGDPSFYQGYEPLGLHGTFTETSSTEPLAQPLMVGAALHAICNISAFETAVRLQLASYRGLVDCLVRLLFEDMHSVRAAFTLLNLAEAHANRAILLNYEWKLVEAAKDETLCVKDTVAQILHELTFD